MEIHYQRNVGFFFYSSPHSPSISVLSVEFGWKIVLVGYGFGPMIGGMIGNIVAKKKT